LQEKKKEKILEIKREKLKKEIEDFEIEIEAKKKC
jgi:hypothetical protein